jgi:monoterpene epsilon-lactone hydrolase
VTEGQVSPEARVHRDLLARFVTPLLSPDRSLKARRHALEALEAFTPEVAGVTILPVDEGAVRGEWVRSAVADGGGLLLYFHGGGYSLGSPSTHRSLVANLALSGAVSGFALDYRLAPENPFPGAVEDALAAYRWLIAGGASPRKVILAGDSAGGGLAVACLLEIRRLEMAAPAGAVLLSPWADLTLSGASIHQNASTDVTVTGASLAQFASDYLQGQDPRHPLASPAMADLSGLPPLLIQVGGDEILLSDSLTLAERAKKAGVEVELDIAPGMWHVWQAWVGQVPEAGLAIGRVGRFIRRVLGTPGQLQGRGTRR